MEHLRMGGLVLLLLLLQLEAGGSSFAPPTLRTPVDETETMLGPLPVRLVASNCALYRQSSLFHQATTQMQL